MGFYGVLSLLLIGMHVTAAYDVTTLCRLEEVYPDYRREVPPQFRSISRPFGSPHTYRVASLEVRARTDALGLPFKMPNGSVVGPTVGSPVPECSPMIGGCLWKTTGWRKAEIADSIPMPPLELPQFASRGLSGDPFYTNETMAVPFHDRVSFSVKPSSRFHETYVYLLDYQADLQSSNLYYLSIRPQDWSYSSLAQCGDALPSNVDWREMELKGHMVSRTDCVYLKRFYLVMELHPSWYNITIQIVNRRLQLLAGDVAHQTLISTRVLEHPINVKFVMISTSDELAPVAYHFERAVFSQTEENGSLISSPFLPTSSILCVAVTYYIPEDCEGGLVLFVITNAGRHVLRPALSDKGEWRTDRVMTVVNTSEEVRVEVVAKRGVLVHWLSRCNPEDEVDIFITTEESMLTETQTGWDVAGREKNPHTTNQVAEGESCLNGGRYDTSQKLCHCPVGFGGRLCDQGCGPNRFGFRCEDVCSLIEGTCRGYKLCSPKQPCLCAPGFEGDGCRTKCQPGKYGAGCTESCGKCLDSAPCDRYTGVCPDMCESGWMVPLCQQEYSYLKVPPIVTPVDFTVLSVNPVWQLAGSGSPRFMQIQYQEVDADQWISLPQILVEGGKMVNNVTGLLVGTLYQVRVVLTDVDGFSYQGDRVPVVVVRTACTAPESVDYGLTVLDVSNSGFLAKWKYTQEDTWCKVTNFELQLKDLWQWRTVANRSAMGASVSHLPQGTRFSMRVRAVTSAGPVAYSPILDVTTSGQVLGPVLNVQVTSRKPTELHLNWSEPPYSNGRVLGYIVEYQCRRLLSCPSRNCSNSAGRTNVTMPAVILRGLWPHALYSVRVAAVVGAEGPRHMVMAATDHAAPGVSPSAAENPITARTNNSLCASWRSPVDCSAVNGYPYNYRYELRTGDSVVIVGTTTESSACFSDLTMATEYELRVFLETSGGWSEQHPLVIAVDTHITDSLGVRPGSPV